MFTTCKGPGLFSPINGAAGIIVEGVVVGDFQDTSTGLSGFFLQEEDFDADSDPMTSEGVFVRDNGFGTPVAVGDVVRVQGDVNEFFSLTELRNVVNVAFCSSGASVSLTDINLPVAAVLDLEHTEGMLVRFPGTLYASGNFNQAGLARSTCRLGRHSTIRPTSWLLAARHWHCWTSITAVGFSWTTVATCKTRCPCRLTSARAVRFARATLSRT